MNVEAFREHLEWAEDRRRFPYLDTAEPPRISIGCGRNLTDRGLSEDEIDYLLRNDIHMALQDAMKLRYWPSLNDARQIVIADMVFNLGYSRFLGFKKLNAALDESNWQEAANQMIDSLWYEQVGRRAVKLVEAMRSGKWS